MGHGVNAHRVLVNILWVRRRRELSRGCLGGAEGVRLALADDDGKNHSQQRDCDRHGTADVANGDGISDPTPGTTLSGTVRCHDRWPGFRRSSPATADQSWTGDAPPLYLDVATFGPQAEACAKYLRTGRQVAVSGRLVYNE